MTSNYAGRTTGATTSRIPPAGSDVGVDFLSQPTILADEGDDH